MKNLSVAFSIFIAILLSACATQNPTTLQKAKLFDLRILQDGKVVEQKNGVVYLNKKPFKLSLNIPKGNNAFVNFSTSAKLFALAQTTTEIQSVLGFDGTGMAEEKNNPQRNVFLTDEGWHVWPTSPEKFIRFDRITDTGASIIGERTIESMHDLDNDKIIPLSGMNTLYIVYCNLPDLSIKKAQAIDTLKLVFK